MDTIKIVFSSEDEAGTLVARQLREKFGFAQGKTLQAQRKAREAATGVERSFSSWMHESLAVELIEVKERLSNESEFIAQMPEIFAAKLIIFASRHVSASGTPCFTAHATGNFTQKVEFGGNALELGCTSARASACLLRWLKKEEGNLQGYGVFREATHHGPTSLPWPSFFAELGSTQVQWKDEKAAAHLAQAILSTAENNLSAESNEFTQGIPSIGFGGTHYCSKFSALEFAGKNCFSHVASKHVLDGIEKQGIAQALEKTVEKSEGKQVEALLDWKGTTMPQREKLVKFFGELNLQWKRI